MSDPTPVLPAGFEALEPFVSTWALGDAAARARARLDSSESQRVAFFEAVRDLVAPALDHLDAKPLAALDAAEQRLMALLLSFAHVALAVEVQGGDEARHAVDARCLTITRAPADA
jgi:hypothetical protein